MSITIALIPARSGSKGVRDKNIRIVGGKPLVHHSLLLAERSKHIDKVFVSTDGKQISRISKIYGAEVIIRWNNKDLIKF